MPPCAQQWPQRRQHIAKAPRPCVHNNLHKPLSATTHSSHTDDRRGWHTAQRASVCRKLVCRATWPASLCAEQLGQQACVPSNLASKRVRSLPQGLEEKRTQRFLWSHVTNIARFDFTGLLGGGHVFVLDACHLLIDSRR